MILAALLAIVLISRPAHAQDALTAGPGVYKKVMENARVRVLEATFKPGAKVGLHSHPEHIFYMLTDGTLVIKPPGRTAYEMTFVAGEASYLPATTRALENDGDKAVRALIVELKTPPPGSARRVVAGKKGAKGSKRARRR